MTPASPASGGPVPGHVAWVGRRAPGGASVPAAHEERALLALVDTATALGIGWLTVQEPSGARALRGHAADLAERGVLVYQSSTAPGSPIGPQPLVPVGSPRLSVLCVEEGSGRRELVRAVRELDARGLRPEDVDEAAISDVLGVPDVDLLVLTGSDRRVPDLLVWQVAYSEIVVLDDPWPEVSPAQFHAAVAEYRRRDRRYGGLVTSR